MQEKQEQEQDIAVSLRFWSLAVISYVAAGGGLWWFLLAGEGREVIALCGGLGFVIGIGSSWQIRRAEEKEGMAWKEAVFGWWILGVGGLLLGGASVAAAFLLSKAQMPVFVFWGLLFAGWWFCIALVGRRSWVILRVSLSVLWKEEGLRWAFLWSLGVGGLLSVGVWRAPWNAWAIWAETRVGYLGLLGVIFGMYALFSMALVCLQAVFCVISHARFTGQERSLAWGFKRILRRLGTLLGWGLISGFVGLLLHGLDGLARLLRGLGDALVSENLLVAALSYLLAGIAWLFSWGLAFVWMLKTIFLVPMIVVEGRSLREGMRESEASARKVWGDQVSNDLGALLPLTVLIVFVWWGIFAGLQASLPLRLGFASFGTWLFVVLGFAWTAISNTALYVLSTTSQLPPEFKEAGVQGFDPAFDVAESRP